MLDREHEIIQKSYTPAPWNAVDASYIQTKEGVLGVVRVKIIDEDGDPVGTVGFEMDTYDINGWMRVLRDLKRGMRWELIKHIFGR